MKKVEKKPNLKQKEGIFALFWGLATQIGVRDAQRWARITQRLGAAWEPQPSLTTYKWSDEGSPLEPQPSLTTYKWSDEGSPLEPQPSLTTYKWSDEGSPLDAAVTNNGQKSTWKSIFDQISSKKGNFS